MSKVEKYQDLKVWQKGIEIVKSTYLIAQLLPEDEKFGLISQLKRSAISIPSSIAEGFGRGSSKSFANFLSIARGSLVELETQLYLTQELGLIKKLELNQINEIIVEESKMLNSLIKKIKINNGKTIN